MLEVVYLSFVTASISFTVTETRVFQSFRGWIKDRNRLLGDLFSCGYCFGHWVSFGLTAIYTPRLFQYWRLLDYFLTALIIAWFAGIQWAIMCWLMDKTGK